MPWQVKFFQNQRGDYPVKDFIIKQDEKTYAKILALIKLLNNNGPFIRPPYVKKIINNIWELRITGKTQVRIFYIYFNNVFYLLHIFIKKTQKTPSSEIKIALDRAKRVI